MKTDVLLYHQGFQSSQLPRLPSHLCKYLAKSENFRSNRGLNSQKWSVDWWLPGPGRGENGKMLVKGYKLPVIRRGSSGNVMHSMLTIANNIALCTSKWVGVDFKCSHHQYKEVIM